MGTGRRCRGVAAAVVFGGGAAEVVSTIQSFEVALLGMVQRESSRENSRETFRENENSRETSENSRETSENSRESFRGGQNSSGHKRGR